MKYVIALDAGTTSVRAFVYDPSTGRFIHGAQQEVGQAYPHPGWVEQDASEIYFKSAYVLTDCVNAVGAENVAGIGITNQRETVVMWNRESRDGRKNPFAHGTAARRVLFGKQNKVEFRPYPRGAPSASGRKAVRGNGRFLSHL